ncbi:MAG TPA: phosphatase PAP2 family protein [Amycolatopsis sp.]|uniref:phosphatase PAP2 family protein n=1 Tax=Amycolatopsis sp. TaxID=37632 RepID=UPI002F41D3E4
MPAGTPGRIPATTRRCPACTLGWSLWCAFAVWCALRGTRPRAALVAWLFPVLMVADVLATGNHYVLDVAGGVALLAVAVVAASLWAASPVPPSRSRTNQGRPPSRLQRRGDPRSRACRGWHCPFVPRASYTQVPTVW